MNFAEAILGDVVRKSNNFHGLDGRYYSELPFLIFLKFTFHVNCMPNVFASTLLKDTKKLSARQGSWELGPRNTHRDTCLMLDSCIAETL